MNLLKPEYLWRPNQILRRIQFRPAADIALPLPWNCTINASSTETIGRAIATQGVYDLVVTEAILRLADVGDTTVDAGGNIGYMSLVLALAAGRSGRVFCFEPNTDILPTLYRNVKQWKALSLAPIEVNNMALSDHSGEGKIGYSAGYSENRGLASLEVAEGGVPVTLCRLDSLGIAGIGVMKIDVEGHEAAVLSGAGELLAAQRIRDIIFEEHRPFPAPSHQILLQHGYRIFRLTRSFWNPLLLSPEEPSREEYAPSNFVATMEAPRALRRFSRWGWISLSLPFRQRAGNEPV